MAEIIVDAVDQQDADIGVAAAVGPVERTLDRVRIELDVGRPALRRRKLRRQRHEQRGGQERAKHHALLCPIRGPVPRLAA